jgi:hypothetical protein
MRFNGQDARLIVADRTRDSPQASRGVCRLTYCADIAQASSLEVIAVTLEQTCERALDFS